MLNRLKDLLSLDIFKNNIKQLKFKRYCVNVDYVIKFVKIYIYFLFLFFMYVFRYIVALN